jgi:hypothetical protein
MALPRARHYAWWVLHGVRVHVQVHAHAVHGWDLIVSAEPCGPRSARRANHAKFAELDDMLAAMRADWAPGVAAGEFASCHIRLSYADPALCAGLAGLFAGQPHALEIETSQYVKAPKALQGWPWHRTRSLTATRVRHTAAWLEMLREALEAGLTELILSPFTVQEWPALRDLLRAHGARLTEFGSQWLTEEPTMLALARDMPGLRCLGRIHVCQRNLEELTRLGRSPGAPMVLHAEPTRAPEVNRDMWRTIVGGARIAAWEYGSRFVLLRNLDVAGWRDLHAYGWERDDYARACRVPTLASVVPPTAFLHLWMHLPGAGPLVLGPEATAEGHLLARFWDDLDGDHALKARVWGFLVGLVPPPTRAQWRGISAEELADDLARDTWPS